MNFRILILASTAIVMSTAAAAACPIGKLCGHTLIAQIKETDASGDSRDYQQRMLISPQGEVSVVTTMGNQNIRITCARAERVTAHTCPGRSCIESTANGILDMAEARFACRYSWNAASQTLTMQSSGNLRLVRRSMQTPGVMRENFPRVDEMATLAQVQQFQLQNVHILRVSGNSCSMNGQSSATGVVSLRDEFARVVTRNNASTRGTSESLSCELKRGRHLEN